MIAAWMLFAIEISALLFAAAWMAERALLAARRPVRGVWMIAIVGANFLPILLSQISIGTDFANKWSLEIAPESMLAKIGAPLLVLWVLGVAVGLFVCGAAVWRMARARPSWKHEHVDNTPVLVSHDIGPALVGVLHYSIVVPQWAYSLEERARGLLLSHEREHARHYDPLLLAVAVLAVVVAPWNLFNWLFLKRLHLAVELDCDQRVLQAQPDARGYGALLLDVAERVLPSVMPAAAFVEHGSSLETRIKAMNAPKQSFRSVRVTAGLASALVFGAAACFTPRPYAIIIVPQIVTVPASVQGQVSVPPVLTAPAAMQSDTQTIGASSNSARTAAGGPEGILPVPPSARVAALDEAYRAQVRAAVVAAAPRTLGAWPRRDSSLVLLFNDHGSVVKQTAVGALRVGANNEPGDFFSQIFMITEIGALKSTASVMIYTGVEKQLLDVPLTVYSGRLPDGAPIPLTRGEILPARESMLATLRKRHPELLNDTAGSSTVGALLYGSKGQLLMSAAAHIDAPQKFGDGSSNPAYAQEIVRKAFGAVMDSGVVVQSGLISISDDPQFSKGPSRIFYAVLAKQSEFVESLRQVQNSGNQGQRSGMSARTAGPSDLGAMNRRLMGLVDTRVPDAFGAWSRSDSAVVFLFDADDQLIARRAAPIVPDWQLLTLARLISQRIQGVASDDVDAVGGAVIPSSTSGRHLDKALNVYWGRLRRGVVFPTNRR